MSELHLNTMLSAGVMEFYAEMFFRSITTYGEIKNWNSSIHCLDSDKITNPYLLDHCTIQPYDNLEEKLHPPWFGGIPLWKISPQADVVLIHDCDLLVLKPIAALIETCANTKTICGVGAYTTPFAKNSYQYWKELSEHFQLPAPRKMYVPWFEQHKDVPEINRPSYLNYGVVAVPAEFVAPLGAIMLDITQKMTHFLEPNQVKGWALVTQMILSVAIDKLNLPVTLFEETYNYLDVHKNFDIAVMLHYQEVKKRNCFELNESLSNFVLKMKQAVLSL